MKKNLLYLFTVLCVLSFFSSCNDDEKPEVPPTVDEVLATYSADKLKAEIDGVAAAEDAKVEIAEKEDKTISIKLINIVPGAKEIEVPNAKFEAVTKSAYISKLTGEVSDNASGYKIVVEGTVEEKILTAKISLTELSGDTINTKPLHDKVYKGKMNIGVTGMDNIDPIDQRVYISSAGKIGSTKRDTAMVKLQIKNFTFGDLVLGNIIVDTIPVQKRGDVFAFKVQKREIKLNQKGVVVADLQGTIIGDEINLNLDIDATGLKVKVDFAGNIILESKAAKLTNMKIENPAIIYFNAGSTSATVRFWGNDAAKLTAVTPTFTLSEKAKVDSVSLYLDSKWVKRLDLTSPLDLSVLYDGKNDYIQYTISAEDPNEQTKYKILVDRLSEKLVFTMDNWLTTGEPEGLASSNMASTFLPLIYGIKIPRPVDKYADGIVRVMSFRTDTANQNTTLVPAITAGTLFTGKFVLAMDTTLKSTKFGLPYRMEPATFKVTYKYTPGTEFYKQIVVEKTTDEGKKEKDNDAELVPGKTDECSVNAYLYEVSSLDETLNGTNINTSDKVILKATLPDGNAKADFTTLELPFISTGNGTYDPAKMYKIAIVCSSSKEGDLFSGAPESTLYIKHLEVIAK